MLDSSLVALLTGSGAAGVFCVLFIVGLIFPKSVVEDLKAERDLERSRADAAEKRAEAAVTAAQAARDVLSALQAGVALGHQRQEAQGPLP